MNEVHGDWTVQCGSVPQGASTAISCGVSQEQQDPKSQQRVLAIVVSPSGSTAKGTLLMPFGLALDKGVSLQIDDNKDAMPGIFHTCLPAGCLVALDWPAATVKALRTAKKLSIAATAENGQPVSFSISMTGFSSAFDRAAVLIGPPQP